jgi:DNA-binding response OmpR family regulator
MVQKKLLVVDDEIVFLESIAILFSSEGFNVVKLLNPRNIFSVLEEGIPDIILLDLYFPKGKGSGFETLTKLKSHDKFSNIPVLVITADTTINIDKAFAYGADDCIFKPLDVEDLIKRVNRLVQ